MNTIIKSFLIILLFISAACDDQIKNDQGINDTLNSELLKTEAIVAADNQFAFDLFDQMILHEESEKNIMVSPVSISLALAMAYNGADGKTKEEMALTLRKNGFSMDEINETYRKLMLDLEHEDGDVILTIANSIWQSNVYEVLQSFKDVNKTYYDSEVYVKNFSDPATVNEINQWASDNTKGKIDLILEEIPAAAVLYLINAVYFNGIWKYKFDTTATIEGIFYDLDNASHEVAYMQNKMTVRYAKNNHFTGVELPYGDGQFNMYALLPSDNSDISALCNYLTPETWEEALATFDSSELKLYLPRFKFSYEKKLNNILQNMGMELAFTSSADFSNINPARDIFISMVKHFSYIDVNENGTEAAAVTIIQFERTSLPQYPVIWFNKPFMFMITEKTTGSIVFMGRVMLPQY